MSYQVIARKWRPQTFEEVTGQEAVTRTLRNAVEYDRLHHAYIFSGARGVGKTTTARLLAKALNCHKTDKPNPKPCTPSAADACDSCKEIADGRSIDVLEIDAASHTGIDDVRDTIIENININPARDRNKVFIIDEVHQLSKAAFNALLKTLEEPPPNVVFIMATTELHKVPDTILSRCQEFEFKTIALNKIFDSLKNIAEVEKVVVSDAALREVARAGEGSMRDAQSAFDQVISFSGEKIEVEDVVNALGIAGVDILMRTVNGIAEHNTLEAFEIVEELDRRGHDLRSFCRDLLSFFRDLLVAKVAIGSEGLLDWAAVSREELSKQAALFSEADLLRFFNSLADTEAQLRTATQPRYILEIGLVKLMEMGRVAPIEKLLEQLASLEKAGMTLEDINAATGPVAPEQPKKNDSLSSMVESFSSAMSAAPPAEKKTEFLAIPADEVPFETSFIPTATKDKEAVIETVRDIIPVSAPAPPAYSAPVSFPIPAPVYPGPPQAVSAAVAFAPFTPSEDFIHFEDAKLDAAYESALMRAGDDLSAKFSLDLSAITASAPKYAPPPAAFTPPLRETGPVERQAESPAAPPPQNGAAKPAAAIPFKRPVQSASAKDLTRKFKSVLERNGKKWLARCFDDVSRLHAGEADLIIHLSQDCSYWKQVLLEEENLRAISEAAAEVLDRQLSPVIRVEGESVALVVPSVREIEARREAAAALWQSAGEDPAVKHIIKVFKGQIIGVQKTSPE